MNEPNSDSAASPVTNPRRPSRLPRIMLVVSVLVAIFIFLVQKVFLFQIEESLAIGRDIVNLLCYGLIMLTFISCFIVVVFLSRWTMKRRMIVAFCLFAAPAIFFALGPIPDGDVGIARFEPFWMSKPVLKDVESDGAVDLSVESKFDFPRYLGPYQDVQSTTSLELDESKFPDAELIWKQTIGPGWSGFTARNGFAVTMEQRDKLECVTCYDIQSGKLQWLYSHPARHQDSMNLGRVGPRSTPTIHQGKVFAVGANGNVVCLNGSDGSVLWQKDLNPLLGIEFGTATDRDGFEVNYESNTTLAWGRSGSPLIVDNLVIVPGGGPNNATQKPTTLLAFDQSTGELVWKGGTEMIAYGSPVLATVSALSQILMVGESAVMGFNPKNGEMLWSHPRPGASNAAANCSQATVASDNHILTSKGYPDGGGELIALEITEDKLIPKSIWANGRVLKTKFTNPVIFDGHAYSISNGFLECANLAKGERIWKHRKRLENGQILKVGNYILTHSENGVIHMVEPDPKGYKELGSFRTIRGKCWNTLCVYQNYLLVRSELEAACFRLPALSTNFDQSEAR